MARTASRSKKVLTTTEARNSLPTLVKRAARVTKPGKRLRSNSIEIQPRGEERKALLIPEVDVEEAERQIAELQETIEDIELMRLIEERVVTGEESGTPLAEVILEFGEEDLLEGGPAA
jgi:hypothetical protein